MKDIRGRDILKGDIVVYPRGHASTLRLVMGTVEKAFYASHPGINGSVPTLTLRNIKGRLVVLTSLRRVCVVAVP